MGRNSSADIHSFRDKGLHPEHPVRLFPSIQQPEKHKLYGLNIAGIEPFLLCYRELDSMILMGPFQLELFYDSMKCNVSAGNERVGSKFFTLIKVQKQ